MIPVQSTVQPITRLKDLPSPGKNVYERLDSSIPYLVQRLFPKQSCALHYLVGLLAHAHAKQYALPDISRETEGDIAIVSVKDYQELRRLLRLAYETAHMYTLIFEALGLLKVQKCKGQLNLVIPLHSYHPPTGLLSKLGQLREHYRSHRPHVGRLVETVIERLGDLERDEMQQLHGAQDAFSAELVDLIQQALSAEGVQGDTRQIAQCIAAKTMRHFQVERGQTTSTMVKGVRKNLPLQDQKDCGREALSREESAPVELNRQEKGVAMHLVRRNLLINPARLDSQREESTLAESVQEAGRFRDENLSASCQAEAVAVHTCRPAHARATSNLSAGVDSAKPLPLRIDNGKKNNNKRSATDSVIVIDSPAQIEKSTAIVSSAPSSQSEIPVQAAKLALFVEGMDNNLGAYINLIKNHPEQRRRAALIATLIRKHYPQGKRPLDRPGGYLTACCKEYAKAGIPNEFAELVTQCIHLSYSELEEVVKRTYQHLASMSQCSPSGSTETSLFKPKKGPAMDKDAAETLARRIPQEDSYVQVKGVWEVCHGEGKAYVVGVMIPPLAYVFSSSQDWEDYHAHMQTIDES